MCDLTSTSKLKSKTGYKVVLKNKKDNKFYSIAMGFCYDDFKEIPKIINQKNLSNGYFKYNILTTYFKDDMVGRTALFVNKNQAIDLFNKLKQYFEEKSKYKLCLVKAKVYKDLLKGTYQSIFTICSVIAGRKIKFIEVIEEY